MPGERRLRSGLVLVSCLLLAGCAGTSEWLNSENTAPPFRNPDLSMHSASGAIAIGTATKADVIAALGPAAVFRFDSGFEVWVYRGKSPETTAGTAELVVLFAPTGIAKKTRIRPAYAGQQQ